MDEQPGELSDRKHEDKIEEQFQGRNPLDPIWSGRCLFRWRASLVSSPRPTVPRWSRSPGVRCKQRFVIDAWTVALLVSTALHAGFQLTVTFVVYPGLADVQPDRWPVAHARHSRRANGRCCAGTSWCRAVGDRVMPRLAGQTTAAPPRRRRRRSGRRQWTLRCPPRDARTVASHRSTE